MESMEYIKIPLSGRHGRGKFALVDGDYDGEYFSQYKWYLNYRTGYPYAKIEGKTCVLHKLICKVPKGLWVDHIDRDKLNNRSCNLRPATPSENKLNTDYVYPKKFTEEQLKAKRRAYRQRPDQKAKKSEYDRRRYLTRVQKPTRI